MTAIGSRNRRIFAAWIGQQGSGKTYQLGQRIAKMRGNPRISCVFVLDRLREFGDVADMITSSAGQYLAMIEERGNELPRVVACQCGLDAEAYDWVYVEAVAQGDCCLVFDEAWEFLPAGKPLPNGLREVVFAGRHLRALNGQDRPIHILLATQYPRTVHAQIWSQVSEVWCSRLRGDRARAWVRDFWGKDKLEIVEKLESKQWTRIDN